VTSGPIWRGAGGYRPQGSPGGWLWVITRRQAALWLRRRGPAGLSLTDLADQGLEAADPAEAAVFRTELAAAVRALGPEGSTTQEVWRLMYVEDRTVTEVAGLMGVPEGTVKSRAHRVRQLMRTALRQPVRNGG